MKTPRSGNSARTSKAVKRRAEEKRLIKKFGRRSFQHLHFLNGRQSEVGNDI